MTIIWESSFSWAPAFSKLDREIEKTILKIDGREKIILKMKEEAKEKEPSLSHQK